MPFAAKYLDHNEENSEINKISFLVSLICCVAIGMLVSGAGAVMKGLSTAELVGSSEAVIIGEVIDVLTLEAETIQAHN